MSGKKSTHVSEEKKKTVSELAKLVKSKKTILIASIKNIPGSQFQEIAKMLRGKAIVKVPKKSIIFRAIDASGNDAVKKLKDNIGESVAILFSDMDSFELASELISKKTPAKAKAGQEAPEDIEISAGPTDLVPGPAISELGAVGIQIKIEKGKIHIKEAKVIARKGEKISAAAADIMGKLDIKPFSIGFIPLASFDTKENKLYLEIKIDKEETLKELKTSFGKALAFSVEINYISEDTIKLMIGKAGRHEKVFEELSGKEEVKEDNTVNSENKGNEADDKSDVNKQQDENNVENETNSQTKENSQEV